MKGVWTTILAVVVVDQSIKLMLRRVMGNGAFALGPCGSVRVVAGQIWLNRIGRKSTGLTVMWCVWLVAAAALILCNELAPLNAFFVGLLLGASLSHAVESSLRGWVTDYVCLRSWPAFNLADLALAAGMFGIMVELVIILYQKAF